MDPAKARRLALPLLILTALVVGTIQAYRKQTSELPVYTQGAERMSEGAEIYRPDEHKPFTYPPFFALPFVPLTWFPEALHRGLFFLLNVLLLVGTIRLLSGLVSPHLEGWSRKERWTFWGITLLLSSRHLLSVFENQSHDLIVCFLVMLGTSAYARSHCKVAGIGLGLAAACKATPVLFLPVYAWQRHWTAALVGLAALVLATLLPDLLFPRQDGALWVRAWFDTFLSGMKPGEAAEAQGAWASWNKLNQSLTGTLYRLSHFVGPAREHYWDVRVWSPSPGIFKAANLGVQLLLIAATALLCLPRFTAGLEPRERALRVLGQAGLLVACMVLLSPMSSKSHFCVLLIPISFVVADHRLRSRDPILLAFLIGLLLLGPLSSKGVLKPFTPEDLGVGPNNFGDVVLAYGNVTACALICWLAAGHALFHRHRAGVGKLAGPNGDEAPAS